TPLTGASRQPRTSFGAANAATADTHAADRHDAACAQSGTATTASVHQAAVRHVLGGMRDSGLRLALHLRRSIAERRVSAAARATAEVTTVPFIADNPKLHIGDVVSTGHCMRHVQVVAGVPHSSRLRRGDPVRGASCAPGTVIGTFDKDGRYANATDGSSHVAILLAETDEGLL